MNGLSFYNISLFLGILGFISIMFSFLSGMHIIKPGKKYRLHRRIGIAGFLMSSVHAVTMLYYTLFS
jgi:hypothetical protein